MKTRAQGPNPRANDGGDRQRDADAQRHNHDVGFGVVAVAQCLIPAIKHLHDGATETDRQDRDRNETPCPHGGSLARTQRWREDGEKPACRALTPPGQGVRLTEVRFPARSIARLLPIALTMLLVSSPVAECFAPPPGAEMPCCAAMHHDESCGQAGSAAQCCEHASVQGATGIVAAKHRQAVDLGVELSPLAAAPWLSLAPILQPLSLDTGPPPRTIPLHVVLSVFLI